MVNFIPFLSQLFSLINLTSALPSPCRDRTSLPELGRPLVWSLAPSQSAASSPTRPSSRILQSAASPPTRQYLSPAVSSPALDLAPLSPAAASSPASAFAPHSPVCYQPPTRQCLFLARGEACYRPCDHVRGLSSYLRKKSSQLQRVHRSTLCLYKGVLA